jgi:ribosomal-protein-alanine N-acetyltransferase
MSCTNITDAGDGLCTRRLRLRRFTAEDVGLVAELNADPEVMRYLGGALTPEQSRAWFQGRILDYYTANPGLGVWATELREGGDCVGMHVLNHIQGEPLIQVGYRLFRRHWGQGYATEMSLALLRYGYTWMGLSSIAAITSLDNVVSQRVLLKAGLRRQGERSFPHPALAVSGPLAWFERSAQDWLAEYGIVES